MLIHLFFFCAHSITSLFRFFLTLEEFVVLNLAAGWPLEHVQSIRVPHQNHHKQQQEQLSELLWNWKRVRVVVCVVFKYHLNFEDVFAKFCPPP